ncbi:MAG TPA: DUF1036 domain-containing protein [Actinomycetota bacterium]|nr:DUF1036 domain-containing protein [Actinomycetota bacterium]
MLTFCNGYREPIATAISFWEPEECGGPEQNGWHNIGWYWVDPGTCRVVYRNDVDDAGFWYVYAEATDGVKWSGEFPTRVKNVAFDICDWPPDTSMGVVDFRELDVGDAENCTVTFR